MFNKEIELAYFAGLIDGEGHIGCQMYSGAKRPVLQLQMTNKEVVEKFANYFGTTLRELNSPSHQAGYAKGHKQIYHTRCETHIAYNIVKQLRPYLIVKAQDADIVLAYYEGRKCNYCNKELTADTYLSKLFCSKSCQQKNYRKSNPEKFKKYESERKH